VTDISEEIMTNIKLFLICLSRTDKLKGDYKVRVVCTDQHAHHILLRIIDIYADVGKSEAN
jgi:hypothetical protein